MGNFVVNNQYNLSDLSAEQQSIINDDKMVFVDTYTIEQFKDLTKVDKVKIRENEKTSKLFFTYGTKTGAVSHKGIPQHPMISLVLGKAKDEAGNYIPGKVEAFYLFHEEGTGGAPVVAEF